MHTITFYPLGNADTCLIELASGRKLLFDYAAMRDASGPTDRRADLPALLRAKLKGADRNDLDVVAYTHADDDHIHGSTEFFYLDHARKYQDANRVHITELWVPAAMVLDTDEDICEEARVLRDEARYRLREGEGVRVFSRPSKLEEWLKKQGLRLKDREHLISDAGTTVPGFDATVDGLEFFVHSPFAVRNAEELEDRNGSAIILQASFAVDGEQTNLFLCGDTDSETLAAVVQATRKHNNEDRLRWDIYDIPHHCSYKALSSEKGDPMTLPNPEIGWLMQDAASDRPLLVSCSEAIPDDDTTQPPHKQAFAYYSKIARDKGGEIHVTMQHPTESKPEPLVIKIQRTGAAVEKAIIGAGQTASHSRPPRAG